MAGSTWGVLLLCLTCVAAACGDPSDARPAAPPPAEVEGPAARREDVEVLTPDAPPLEPGYRLDDLLRLNHVQMKGSHNSYHLRPLDNDDPQWAYDVPPIPEQLENHGVRSIELDIHYRDGEFWALHLWGEDPRSTCPKLRQCLEQTRAWSDANPGHHPLLIFLEFRDQDDAEKLIDHLEELEDLVNRAWPREKVLEPDDVVGTLSDVKSAVLSRGWPTLGEVRGKVLFVMLALGDAPYKYAYNGSGLWGRRMFVVSTDSKWRHAGILVMDSPIEQQTEIRDMVRRGFLVRTRTDDLPARGRDFWTKRDAALRSGAHVLATDYPADATVENYSVNMPGGAPSRCNPLTAPPECLAEEIEAPALLRLTPPR